MTAKATDVVLAACDQAEPPEELLRLATAYPDGASAITNAMKHTAIDHLIDGALGWQPRRAPLMTYPRRFQQRTTTRLGTRPFQK